MPTNWFPIPMRGNEITDRLVEARGNPVSDPMRGNENRAYARLRDAEASFRSP